MAAAETKYYYVKLPNSREIVGPPADIGDAWTVVSQFPSRDLAERFCRVMGSGLGNISTSAARHTYLDVYDAERVAALEAMDRDVDTPAGRMPLDEARAEYPEKFPA